MNKSTVIHELGSLLLVLSLILVVPCVIGLCYEDEEARGGPLQTKAFVLTIMATAVTGAGFCFTTKRRVGLMGAREGFAIVALGWMVVAFFGAVPFYVSGAFDSFVDAYFETMSGFTTTGASICTNIPQLPHGLLFWRSLTHWLGGMGIVVLVLAILPAIGAGGYQLFRAEVPGPTADRLRPRIAQTAKILWGVYVLLSAAETGLLWLGGMPLFDSACHTFGTMATGGFSTQNASIGHYNSVYFDVVIIVFMFLAGCNFVLHYQALHGDLRSWYRNAELRTYSLILLVCIIVVAASVYFRGLGNPDQHVAEAAKVQSVGGALRYASFQVVSICTTTGYCTADFDLWPDLCRFLLVVLMFVGGSAGSTGGGLKVVRVMLVVKLMFREIRKLVKPRAVLPIRVGGETVEEAIVNSVVGVFALFVFVFVICTLAMAAMGLDLTTALTSVVATLGNIGPGLGGVGATCNYSQIPVAGKWLLTFCMLLGRLELYSVIVLLFPLTWRR